MIEDIDDLEAAEKLDAVAAESKVEGIQNFGVESDIGGKSAGFVALADLVPVLAELRVREARVEIQNGNELQFPR